jgi:hypothetical protein
VSTLIYIVGLRFDRSVNRRLHSTLGQVARQARALIIYDTNRCAANRPKCYARNGLGLANQRKCCDLDVIFKHRAAPAWIVLYYRSQDLRRSDELAGISGHCCPDGTSRPWPRSFLTVCSGGYP